MSPPTASSSSGSSLTLYAHSVLPCNQASLVEGLEFGQSMAWIPGRERAHHPSRGGPGERRIIDVPVIQRPTANRRVHSSAQWLRKFRSRECQFWMSGVPVWKFFTRESKTRRWDIWRTMAAPPMRIPLQSLLCTMTELEELDDSRATPITPYSTFPNGFLVYRQQDMDRSCPLERMDVDTAELHGRAETSTERRKLGLAQELGRVGPDGRQSSTAYCPFEDQERSPFSVSANTSVKNGLTAAVEHLKLKTGA